MSHLSDLINQLCPDGVEYKKLGEVAELVRGNGLQKKDLIDTGLGCIHYGQIYTYFSKHGVATDHVISTIPESLFKTLKQASPGDIIMACTSENLDDVGKNVVWEGNSPIATGGHATIIKPNRDIVNSRYISYFTQTNDFYDQKKLVATGTKVIELSSKKLANIELPIPPLSIQQKIVEILDKFTSLQAELQNNLQMENVLRQKQYEFYRNKLLTFDPNDETVEWKKLGGVASYIRGVTYSKTSEVDNGGYLVLRANNIDLATNTLCLDDIKHISSDVKVQDSKKLLQGDTLICAGSGSKEHVGKVAYIFNNMPINYTFGGFMGVVRVKDNTSLNPRFLFHLIASEFFRDYLASVLDSTTINNISSRIIDGFTIPIPPLSKQQEIVNILDKFSEYTTSLTNGLPAEIELRKQQYDYYRNKLLTFKRKAS